MKKIFLAMACLTLALISCQKKETVCDASTENNSVRMTLVASIGCDDTKIGFADEDNVLKTAWEQYDKVSVFSLDVSGNILTNDIFTATSAGKVAEFDGEFSNHPETASIYVYYPALTEGEGTAEKPWQVPADNSMRLNGSLYGVVAGSCYLDFDVSYQLQRTLDDCSHLEQYMVLSGKTDSDEMEAGKIKVTLEHRSYVLKTHITLPKSGLTVCSLNMHVKSEDGTREIRVGGTGWTTINDSGHFPGGWKTTYNLFFGEDIDSDTGSGLKVDGTEFTAYLVSYAGESWDYVAQETTWYHLTAGDYFTFEVNALDGEEPYTCVLDKKTVTKNLVLENGRMYRLSATLVEGN